MTNNRDHTPSTITNTTPATESGRGVWTEDEHNRFLDALQHYPNGPWRLVAEHVGTRSVRQVQTHAQKYHEKVARRLRGLRKDRRLVQRSEHRIDSDMLEICHELTRDSVPLPPRAERSPHITGVLHRGSSPSHAEKEQDHGGPRASASVPLLPLLNLYPDDHELATPSFDDCLDYLIEALSPSEYDSDQDEMKHP